MAGCDLDFQALPKLTGCPGDNEQFLVGNAVGGLDLNGNLTVGYAVRIWKDMRQCILNALRFVKLQFYVGTSNMNAGDTVLTINVANILVDSVFITLDGVEIPYNDPLEVSYTTVYSAGSVVITFNTGVSTNQQYIVHYAYAT